MNKSVCLHAAFSRSPRVNPWTGDIDPEESAHPYADWASRAHAQVYGPFAFDPVRDLQGLLRGSANLYAKISFSFSPQLLTWLERARPDTYRRILEADRDSIARLGRGNAMAQPYGETPLPALSRRDKRTALRWGAADFRRRFGRPCDGLWLPDQTADDETLEALIAEGISFTVLPARRASRVRIAGGTDADWKDIRPETFNPTRPYRWRSRQNPDAELAVFFPHERLCSSLTSGEALRDGETLRRSVRARLLPDDSAQLVHAAVDAEKLALSIQGAPAVFGRALRHLEADALTPSNYAAFLDRFPPPQEIELSPETPAQEQPWRDGLRSALRELSQSLDDFYGARLDTRFTDPWQARDDYAELIGDAFPRTIDVFFSRHSRLHLKPDEARESLALLLMQKHRLLMLAEPNHDNQDITDAEPLQSLRHACRAIELASETGLDAGPRLRERLAEVRTASGDPMDASQVWSRQAAPAAVSAERAAAHFAILEHLGVGCGQDRTPLPGERFILLGCSVHRHTRPLPGGRDPSWSWQRLVVRDAEMIHRLEYSVCVHQQERLNLAAWILPLQDVPGQLTDDFSAAQPDEFRARLCRRFGQAFFTLDALWARERLQVLRWLMPDPSGNRPRQAFLRDWGEAVGRLRRGEDAGGDRMMELLPNCREVGILPDQLPWAALARDLLQDALRDFLVSQTKTNLGRALRGLSAAQSVGLHLDLDLLRSRVLVWLERTSPLPSGNRERQPSGDGGPWPAERDMARALAEKLDLSPSLFSTTEAYSP